MTATWGLTNTCTNCTKLSIGLSTCTRFSSNHFVQIFYLLVLPPRPNRFLDSNQFVQLKLIRKFCGTYQNCVVTGLISEGHVTCTSSRSSFRSIIRYRGDLPVQRHLKFSHVFGQTSVNSSNTIRPATNRDSNSRDGNQIMWSMTLSYT